MDKKSQFISALPVWIKGFENEKFITMGLYTKLKLFGESLVLRIATSCNYRIFVNNQFYYCGPARAAHGFFRVDEVDFSDLSGEINIAIEVINYAVGSFSELRQSGFIQAEILMDGRTLVATGFDGFEYYQLNERIRKVQRYSFQRPMSESYVLTPNIHNWRIGKKSNNAIPIEVVVCENKKLISRNIEPYKFPIVRCNSIIACGKIINGIKPDKYFKDRSLTSVVEPPIKSPEGFPEENLEVHLTDEIQEMNTWIINNINDEYFGTTKLNSDQFEILSFSCEKTGFLFFNINCTKRGRLYILFDEILKNGDVDPLRLECCNIIRLDVEKGNYNFQSFEAFGMQFIKIICVSGCFTINNIGLYEMICPQSITNKTNFADIKLNSIYNAALETFKQNSVDIFMDCPTRERAGWLCDSYFTAKAEHFFTGKNIIEHNFLENYLLPSTFNDLPQGMVPMCYPADHWDGNFIPNWSLWLIIELSDYKSRSGDIKLLTEYKKRVYDILEWFKHYENEDGLLEKLPGWVFVEWSMANDFVQDINYPTNMLYAFALEKVYELYNDEDLLKKSINLKKLIRLRSFNGEFFSDNEVYIGDKPKLTGEITETCQYYAFFTKTATPELYPELWKTLLEKFGPNRKKTKIYPKVHYSNAFIGNFLRLCLLEENGYCEQILKEIEGYFFHMAELTGTLWEHDNVCASCNHGFASYVGVMISKAYDRINSNN